jgi:hypothetical protein
MGHPLNALAWRASRLELLEGCLILLLGGCVLYFSLYIARTRESAIQQFQQASLMHRHAQTQADRARVAYSERLAQLKAIHTPLTEQQQRLRAGLPVPGKLAMDAHTQRGNWHITHYTLRFPILHEDRFVQWSERLLQQPGARIPACILARGESDSLELEATCTVHWYSWQPQPSSRHRVLEANR